MESLNKTTMAKTFIVSHDGGGAEVLSAYVAKCLDPNDYICYVFGPAKRIFHKKNIANLVDIEISNFKQELIAHNPEIVITSTGWNLVELSAVKVAKARNIKTISLLDHWSNYRERFGYPKENWQNNLPDEVWIGDNYGIELAKSLEFPTEKLKQITNFYFEEIKEYAKKFSKSISAQKRILWLSQPTSTHAKKQHRNTNFWGYTEHGVIKDIISSLDSTSNYLLDIRLHPQEIKDNSNKYHDLLTKNIRISNYEDLVEDISNSELIIGSDSMGLVIANLLDKKAINYIPSNKVAFQLPHTEIKKIDNKNDLATILIGVTKGN
jgi:hypothetical protein